MYTEEPEPRNIALDVKDCTPDVLMTCKNAKAVLCIDRLFVSPWKILVIFQE